MSRNNLLTEIKKHFSIYELVDQETFRVHGERAWKFLDSDMLQALLIIRVRLGRTITVNDWHWDGPFSQRCLRTNTCSIVSKKTSANKLYLSAHVMGKGIDFDVEGMEAEDVRDWILKNEDLFTSKIRLEHKRNSTGLPITWVHLDVYQEEKNSKIYRFNV